ncbi:hypothetical protein GPALN_012063 [Globodera pallida]|nr:hypothetical protein GPALN_012063 [Globodera pallida]
MDKLKRLLRDTGVPKAINSMDGFPHIGARLIKMRGADQLMTANFVAEERQKLDNANFASSLGTVQMPYGGIMPSRKMSSGYKTLSFWPMANRNGKRQNVWVIKFMHAEDGGGKRTTNVADESVLEQIIIQI